MYHSTVSFNHSHVIHSASKPTNHAESQAGLASNSNKKQSSIDFKAEEQKKRESLLGIIDLIEVLIFRDIFVCSVTEREGEKQQRPPPLNPH